MPTITSYYYLITLSFVYTIDQHLHLSTIHPSIMAEQWEQIFKGFGEKTYTISQLIQNANEGDDLSEPLQVCSRNTRER